MYRDPNDFTKYISRRLEKDYSKIFLFESKALIEHVLTVIEIIETFCKFTINYVSQINELEPSNLDMEMIYVHINPSNGTIIVPPMNKKEQTFVRNKQDTHPNFCTFRRPDSRSKCTTLTKL